MKTLFLAIAEIIDGEVHDYKLIPDREIHRLVWADTEDEAENLITDHVRRYELLYSHEHCQAVRAYEALGSP